MAEREFAKGEIAFASETALAESDQILRCVVFGAVDDPEIFRGRVSDPFCRFERLKS